MVLVLGFDPGRDKCGLALVETTGEIIEQQVVNSEEVISTLNNWLSRYVVSKIVMGNQTTASQWKEKLTASFATIPIEMVDERNSSLEARDRYWELYPARGLSALIPKGMRLPPRPIDDIVAIILVERSRDAI
ncbi:UNVERIFIED_CONTAM: resolvase [Euhalothece sp. KZN 001]